MTRRQGTWCTAVAWVLGLVLLAGCGGDKEQERIDLLVSDPAASLKSNCDVFLAHVQGRSGWSVEGAPETKVTAATEELAGGWEVAEGAHVGLPFISSTPVSTGTTLATPRVSRDLRHLSSGSGRTNCVRLGRSFLLNPLLLGQHRAANCATSLN